MTVNAAEPGETLATEVLGALTTPAGIADPYPHYERLRQAGPMATGPDGALVITGYRLASALLRDHRTAKNFTPLLIGAGYPDWEQRPSLRSSFDSMLMLNPPRHTRIRRLVSGSFTPRRVAGLRSAVEDVVAGLLDDLDDAGETDFVAAFGFPLPVTVIGELLGIPPADRPPFRQLILEWTMVLDSLDPATVERADAAATTVCEYLADLAAARRAHPRDDLISALVAGQQAGRDPLTDDELVSTCALILGAGFETTTGLLTNGLRALLSHPDQAARLREEKDLAASAVEELLRYDSPVQFMSARTASEDLSAAGVHVAAGQRIITLLGAANRDPDVFPEPDRLKLDRAGEAPLSFGGGVHYCLGAPLARLEGQIAFPALLRRFPDLHLTADPVHRPGITLHNYTSMPIGTR